MVRAVSTLSRLFERFAPKWLRRSNPPVLSEIADRGFSYDRYSFSSLFGIQSYGNESDSYGNESDVERLWTNSRKKLCESSRTLLISDILADERQFAGKWFSWKRYKKYELATRSDKVQDDGDTSFAEQNDGSVLRAIENALIEALHALVKENHQFDRDPNEYLQARREDLLAGSDWKRLVRNIVRWRVRREEQRESWFSREEDHRNVEERALKPKPRKVALSIDVADNPTEDYLRRKTDTTPSKEPIEELDQKWHDWLLDNEPDDFPDWPIYRRDTWRKRAWFNFCTLQSGCGEYVLGLEVQKLLAEYHTLENESGTRNGAIAHLADGLGCSLWEAEERYREWSALAEQQQRT